MHGGMEDGVGGEACRHASRWIVCARETPGQPCLAFRGGEGGLAGGVVAQVGFTEEP